MVSWESQTGTSGEAEFADRLRDLLLEIPYFRNNPADLMLLDSHGDPTSKNLIAIVRGRGSRTLALAGHFDTASIDNYHELSPLACKPRELTTALLADLTSRPLSGQEAQALVDLQSGEFIPGRGMLDMKSGIAAGVAVLECFAARSKRSGNLILFATPDEERESRGMRSLRDHLPLLLASRGLEIEAAINLDATSDQGDGSLGRAIYEGTIGKLLPFALVVGQSSHAAYPFEGISAQLIGAEILQAIEGNAALSDTGFGDVSPPPICLEARDTRDVYEVTTPERFWLSFNWLYHSGNASDRFDRFRVEIEKALSRASSTFAHRAREYSALVGARAGAELSFPHILTLSEVRESAFSRPAVRQEFRSYEAELSTVENPLRVSQLLTSWLVDAARIKGPAVVIGFAGLHYPPSRIDRQENRHAALMRAIDAAKHKLAEQSQWEVCHRPHFQGISDMSFLGQGLRQGNEIVAANTPATRLVDIPAADTTSFPVVNIGPWGREFHQRLERVYAPYAFGMLPQLIAAIADDFLAEDDDRIMAG